VLHFPRYDKRSAPERRRGRHLRRPDFLITLPNEPLQPIEYLFERCRTNEELRERCSPRARLPALQDRRRLRRRLVPDAAQDRQQARAHRGGDLRGQGDEVVRDISNVKQEIINFRKIVRPQRARSATSSATRRATSPRTSTSTSRTSSTRSERVWDMLENYKEVVEGLEATNESAIAHRTNETFRVLTAISLIFLPLTLIASIFGMNVHVPARRTDTRSGSSSASCRVVVASPLLQAPRMAVVAPRSPRCPSASARSACS
jgi:magnesium transporter